MIRVPVLEHMHFFAIYIDMNLWFPNTYVHINYLTCIDRTWPWRLTTFCRSQLLPKEDTFAGNGKHIASNCVGSWGKTKNYNYIYRQVSNISRTKSQNLNVSHLVSQLSLPNPLISRIFSRIQWLWSHVLEIVDKPQKKNTKTSPVLCKQLPNIISYELYLSAVIPCNKRNYFQPYEWYMTVYPRPVLASGIVVACVWLAVRLSFNKFVCTITHHPFKLGSPNLGPK